MLNYLLKIQGVSSVAILVITIDDKLHFNLQLDKNCLKISNQPNALVRLKFILVDVEVTVSTTKTVYY